MAYIETQVLSDTDRRHLLKVVNVGTAQTDVVIVNAAALSYATQTLTTDAANTWFLPGEVVTSASGGTAKVSIATNTTSVVLFDVSGTFGAGNTVTGATSNAVRTQSGTLTPSSYRLDAQRITYDISSEAKVELKWQGTSGGANNRVLAVLSGQGAFGLESIASRIPNNANSATGNVLLNTVNFTGNSHFTLVLDFSKSVGYAPPRT